MRIHARINAPVGGHRSSPFPGGNGAGAQFRRRRHAISRSHCETDDPRIDPHTPGEEAGRLIWADDKAQTARADCGGWLWRRDSYGDVTVKDMAMAMEKVPRVRSSGVRDASAD